MYVTLPPGTLALLAGEAVLALLALILLLRVLKNSFVYIGNTSYGIVERVWSLRSGNNEPFGPLAVNGSAGFLPQVIRGGWHFFMPFQYRVHRRDLITIDQIGYLIARVGAPLREGQALAEWPEGVRVEDAGEFLAGGGQRGPQRQIIRSGTYAINTALFCVVTQNRIYSLMGEDAADDAQVQRDLAHREGFMPIVISEDKIGIVTVQDGPALQHGEIIAPTVGTDAGKPETFHNSFQDIARFLKAGGRRGRQEQVLVDGTYYINRLFSTVEVIPKTVIEIGTVGVVNSYVGPEVENALSADDGRGRTVEVNSRGIWKKPVMPGKYAFNTYAMQVTPVPTTNFQLRWIEDAAQSASMPPGMSYDDDLKEIPVITADGFEILVPLSIVAHIAPMNAPYIIQRFSRIERLVNQTLDPFISAYFKDAAQQHTLIDFRAPRTMAISS